MNTKESFLSKLIDKITDKKDISLAYHFSKYDFTDYKANDEYLKLGGLERYFTYQFAATNDNDWKYYGEIIFTNGSQKYEELKENKIISGLVTHPDTKCVLLQEICKILWDEDHLKECTLNGIIQMDTMNSVQITLNSLFKLINDEDINKSLVETTTKIKEIKPKAQQSITIKFLLNWYYGLSSEEDKAKFTSQCGSAEGLMDVYHTLGNFIPFPVGCNGPRAEGDTMDYWDLTLLYIYKYYYEKSDALQHIYKDEKTRNKFKSWLDKFGKGSDGWNNFVQINYMSAFVNKNKDGTYGEPIALWEGHFTDLNNPLPKLEECNDYFRNAAKCIEVRGKEMAEELFRRLNNQ